MESRSKFRRKLTNRFLFSAYKLRHLPLAFVAGLQVSELSDTTGTVTVKYGYLTKNPFRSMYFAAQTMAAELSTGVLMIDAAEAAKPSKVSILVTGCQAEFTKKAVGRIKFSCKQGSEVADAFTKAAQTGEGQKVSLRSEGKNEADETVSSYTFEWSVKYK